MFLEIGPVSLVMQGKKDGMTYDFDRERLTEKVRSILSEIGEYLPILKQKAYKIKNTRNLPDVPRKMIEAVKVIDEKTLTPMAAVAGSVSDALKEFLKNEGIDLITINNGGDISIFNKYGRKLMIHIGDIHAGGILPYILNIDRFIEYGIATSGFGGRSFTLGLADSVTVIAGTGAVADAAATFICNCTNVDSDQVVRKRASEIDPLTDIPDDLVTVSIHQLNKNDISKALDNGLNIARNIIKQNSIYDTIITLQGHMVTTINGDNPIKLEVHNGNSENRYGH
jgi:hypothetical protein